VIRKLCAKTLDSTPEEQPRASRNPLACSPIKDSKWRKSGRAYRTPPETSGREVRPRARNKARAVRWCLRLCCDKLAEFRATLVSDDLNYWRR